MIHALETTLQKNASISGISNEHVLTVVKNGTKLNFIVIVITNLNLRMESKKLFLLLCTLWTLSPLSAETALIIQPLTGEEQANALAQIGYVKVTPDSLLVFSHGDFLLSKAAIKDIRHIRYGEPNQPTSIDDVQSATTCRVYPNPTQDRLVIENAEVEKVYIFDLNGRLLQTANLQDGNATLNVSPLPQGEYLLLLNTQTVKFIKH